MLHFPKTLKSWRQARRLSQLDLALEADVSTRHISFLETGRAQPSRDMIGRLSEAMHLPLDARNQMLTHAGFAAQYASHNWQDDEMAPIRQAITRMLTCHMPYPALALDRLWVVRDLNRTAAHLFGQFGLGIGDSLLDLVLSESMPQVVENWPQVAWHIAARLRTESLAQGGVPEFDRAVAHLGAVKGASNKSPQPVVPTVLQLGDQRLSMFSTLAQFGTPEDVTLDDLKIEMYFPMDEASGKLLQTMADPASHS